MNSHVSRRHSKTLMTTTASPIDEQYRAEAEKLHSEIKNLKERLNETERVIRNDSIIKINDNNETKNLSIERSQYQEKKNEEEHRRYREEINNLKSMLFNEIRSLKQKDEKTREKFDNNENNNWKEKLHEQENEIQRLKDNIEKRSTHDIESIQLKFDSQEEFWKLKIENIDKQHKLDMEKLYNQLKLNEKSWENMRDDYLNKISYLEEKQRVELTKDICKKLVNNEDNKVRGNKKYIKEDSDDNSTERKDKKSLSFADKKQVITVNPVEARDTDNLTMIKKDKKKLSSIAIDDFERRKETSLNLIEPKINQWQDQSRSLIEKKNHQIKSSQIVLSKISVDQSSESEESETHSESQSTSESQDSIDTDESLEDDSSVTSEEIKNDKNKKIKSKEELKIAAQEEFDKKLRDLGIDPEWQGIPHKTLKQLTKVINHHRNITSKKLPNFDETRKKIISNVSQIILSIKKDEKKIDDSIKKSPLNKLMKNVKTKAFRAFSINSQENTPREVINQQRQIINKHNLELLPKKLKSPSKDDDKSSLSSSELIPQPRYTSSPSRKILKLPESSVDLKQLSHSYESIKDYLKDSVSSPQSRKSSISISGPLTALNATNVLPRKLFDGSIDKIKTDGLLSLPSSPKNSRSLLKTTTGSVGSLVKKKVEFDLHTDERKLNDDLSEDEFNISSISEEKSEELKASVQNISLKTIQSEKIAEITKKLETQLSSTRQKPVGAVEAMFMKKLNFQNDDGDKFMVNKSKNLFSTYQSEEKIILPMPAPRKVKKSESQSSNLDLDIEELLAME